MFVRLISNSNIQGGHLLELFPAVSKQLPMDGLFAPEENTTTQLQTLGLWENPIGSEGAVAFTDMIATNKSLTRLDLRKYNIQGEGAICLAKALAFPEKNSTVREFYIS